MAKKKKSKKSRNYFNEEEFQKMLKEYQQTTVYRDGVALIKNEKLERKLVDEVTKIANAIIIVYRYYIFEPFDDLRQHALIQCINNFKKFDPKKGTCFDYFSIICKMSLLNYTDRRKKHRNHKDIDEQFSLESRQGTNYENFFDNLEEGLFRIVDENYLGNKRKKYVKITALMIDYLKKTKRFISKSDLYSWCRSWGFKNTEVRGFVNEIKKHYDQLVKLVI